MVRRDARDPRDVVPFWLQVAAAVGWRALVVAGAVAVVLAVLSYLGPVVVPVAVALLLSALLAPLVRTLTAARVPRTAAIAVAILGGLALVGGILTFAVQAIVAGLPELTTQLAATVDAIVSWLTTGPLGLSAEQLRALQDELAGALSGGSASLTAGALTTAVTVGEVLAGALLSVFSLAVFLYAGPSIWAFVLRAVPAARRDRVDVAGRRGLAALVAYTRATAVVAAVDAVGVGIGLAVLGVPVAAALAALVFLGAFIPIIGSTLAGGLAVLITLATRGPVSALIALGVIIAVMQLEGHVLQPLLMGRAVKLHPLAIVLAVSVGLLAGGIAGALLAVPVLAVANSAIRSLRSDADRTVAPEDVHTSEPADSGPPEPGLERQEPFETTGDDDG
ncbi:AI-2E family transporter [Pseudonocardia zijingensis]|jgi:predicted PurR-regulated permease PerM|uniref:AI-2E family transporter n=1 Tax=Pseudonocardia zijingensis TaxID=153376 RepID=A0ABN1P8D6_9PSEU